MKVTMQFSLPEDDHEYRCASDGVALAAVLEIFNSWLRSQCKYGNHEPEIAEAYAKCRQHLLELADDNSIRID